MRGSFLPGLDVLSVSDLRRGRFPLVQAERGAVMRTVFRMFVGIALGIVYAIVIHGCAIYWGEDFPKWASLLATLIGVNTAMMAGR
jgi:hypothetical protein